jgi:TatD DNase family protein
MSPRIWGILLRASRWRGEDPHWLAAQTDDNVRNLFG